MSHAASGTGRVGPPWYWLVGVGLYLLVNALTQHAVSPTADLDQAEQLVFSQDWRLGYSAQPPLYTWLVNLVFGLFGPSLAALQAIKVALLVLLAFILFDLGRQFAFTQRQHGIAMAGLAFVPQIVWESQRDLTHSVLATVLAAALLAQTVRMGRSRRVVDYLLLGLYAGLGLLGKYNLVLFIAALLLAVASTRVYRPLLLDRRIGWAFLAGALVLSPHLYWVAGHLDVATSSSHKLGVEDGGALAGIGPAYFNALAFLSPLWLFALLFASPYRQGIDQAPARFLTTLFVAVLATIAGFVFLTGASEIRDRWYLPLLFFTPLLVAVLANPAGRRLPVYLGLAIVLALAVAAVLPLRTLLADRLGQSGRPNLPYAAHFEVIARQIGEPAVVLVESKLIGGNARLRFPGARIVARDYPSTREPIGRTLILCETAGCQAKFRDWLRQVRGIDPARLTFETSRQPLYHVGHTPHTLYWAATVSGGVPTAPP